MVRKCIKVRNLDGTITIVNEDYFLKQRLRHAREVIDFIIFFRGRTNAHVSPVHQEYIVCETCDRRRALKVCAIDRDRYNFQISNVELLCKSCYNTKMHPQRVFKYESGNKRKQQQREGLKK